MIGHRNQDASRSMSDTGIDLGAYFIRIGYHGPTGPTLAVLSALIASHTASIAFENIDPLVNRMPALEWHALQAKMIGRRRGGYCYEQNTLLLEVLLAVGFTVDGLMARVCRGVPPGRVSSRTHMVLLVTLPEGPYIADVGFGGLTPTAPLALRMDTPQPSPNETYRFMATDRDITLQAAIANGWEDVYRFTTEPHFPIDYHVANWFNATHPQSLFVGNLLVTRPLPGERRTLFNRHYTRRSLNEPVERRVMRSREDYRQVLHDAFDLGVTEDELDPVISAMQRHDADRAEERFG